MKGIEKEIARLQMRHLRPIEVVERIAREHGVTLEAMLGRSNPTGIGPARRSAIRTLFSCGHDAPTIARVMKRDQSSINRVLRDERPS
jgi:hypothetical protein